MVELRKLRILVTGGAGFIGSHLADALLQMNNIVINYDNLNPYYTGKQRNVEQSLRNDKYHLFRADIRNFENVFQAMEGVDVVFHLAAQPGVRYSVEHPLEVSQINVGGTINVLEAARQRRVRKIVYASSSSVYGNPECMPVSEAHPLNPISPYGASKLAGEKYCQAYEKLYGMDIVILRYFTVYGPRQRPDMAIYRFVNQIFEGKRPVVYGDGKQTRDFTYVNDVVAGTIAAAQTEGCAGEAFNLGGGQRISVNDLLQRLIKLCGKEDVVGPSHEQAKSGDVRDMHADISKAGRVLRFEPKTDLEEGLRNFIEWYIVTRKK